MPSTASEPSSGEVYLDGEPTRSLDPLELRRRVGMVFQIPTLFGDSVEEAVLYGRVSLVRT